MSDMQEEIFDYITSTLENHVDNTAVDSVSEESELLSILGTHDKVNEFLSDIKEGADVSFKNDKIVTIRDLVEEIDKAQQSR